MVDAQGTSLLAIGSTLPERELGIGVDRPTRFIRDMNESSVEEDRRTSDGLRGNSTIQERNGWTTLKDGLLPRKTWTIVHVLFWEWFGLDGNTNAGDEYLSVECPVLSAAWVGGSYPDGRVEYNTIQYNAVQYSAVQGSAVSWRKERGRDSNERNERHRQSLNRAAWEKMCTGLFHFVCCRLRER